MRLVRYDGGRLGTLTESDEVVDLTDPLELSSDDPLIEMAERGLDPTDGLGGEPGPTVDDVTLGPPVRWPRKVVGWPANYVAHSEEMAADEEITNRRRTTSYFLKAPSSIVGPSDEIVLPYADRRVDHEIELGYVVGETVTDWDERSTFEDALLGYTIVLDISMRGDESRSSRKSFDSFTVVGPWVVTPEEIDDPHALEIRLDVDGEPRQRGNTDQMIVRCEEILRRSSIGTTIHPGDVFATGTPSGVGALEDGDVLTASIEGIGSMTIPVRLADRRYEDAY